MPTNPDSQEKTSEAPGTTELVPNEERQIEADLIEEVRQAIYAISPDARTNQDLLAEILRALWPTETRTIASPPSLTTVDLADLARRTAERTVQEAHDRVESLLQGRYLKPSEVAEYLGISIRKLEDLLATEEIRHRYVGAHRRIALKEVESYLRRNTRARKSARSRD